jgi:TRAP transporter 4TM/12TM fusion protein
LANDDNSKNLGNETAALEHRIAEEMHLEDVDGELLDEEIRISMKMGEAQRIFSCFGSLSPLQKLRSVYIATACIGMAVFQVYTSAFGTLPSWQHRAVHLCLALFIIYAVYPMKRGTEKVRWIDALPLLAVLAIFLYVLIDYPGPELRQGESSDYDIIVCTVLILLTLEGTRRTSGLAMPIIGALFLIYIFVGKSFPGILSHQGFRYAKMVDQMFNGTLGIFTTPIYVSSTVLALYVIWGSFLMRCGAGQFFTDLALAITGKKTGGPAQAAVLSSAMVGSITGNGAANVAITGSFTIPLMKKIGYEPYFAGAVEAVASQGGNLMPPIMGAAAFIMAEYLGVPYIKVAAAAAIPAIMYYLIAGVIVYIEARKRGLKGLPAEEVPAVGKVFKEGFYFFLPILFIVVMLIVGYSPMKAGFWAIIITIALSYLNKKNRLSALDILDCLEKGAKTAVPVVMACATAGIVVGTISLTGLGVRFSRFAIEIAGGNLPLMLSMIMIASLILGMGMPVSSAYIILAILGVPPLVKAGVPPMAAHMFVLYFGVISGLTPPVAITAYTAAGIAKSDPTKTAFVSTVIGAGGYLLPFMFVYNPELVLHATNVVSIVQSVVFSLIGCVSFAIFMQGYLAIKINIVERCGYLLAAVLLIEKLLITSLIGCALFAVLFFLNCYRAKHRRMS